jgi:putative IMPACT (imprinted ancient) family translation regulator
VQSTLEQIPRAERVDWCELSVIFDYALVTPFERRLPDFEAEVLKTDYAVQVSRNLRLPAERLEAFEIMFADLTAGQGQLHRLSND